MSSLIRNRRVVIGAVLAVVALLAAAGGWYYYSTQYLPAQMANGEETIQTATVRRGNLVVVAGGSGTLVPNAEVDLSFSSGGRLEEMFVEVGDQVQAGEVLVRLEASDAQSQVAQAEINVRLAELQLSELTGTPDAADLAAAQYQLASMQEGLEDLLNGPSAQELIIAQADLATAEKQLQQAQSAYDRVSWRPDAASSSQAMDLWSATAAYDKAKANYDMAVADASEEQIAAAQASVAQAQSNLNSLLDGATAEDLEAAQLNVEQARANLASAQAELEETVIMAPFSGTVTAVTASPGEMVGTSALVTLADLSQPLVEVYLDETDLDLIAVGYEVEVLFDALPDEIFKGYVVRVDPVLVEMEGAPTILALATLEQPEDGSRWPLPGGLNASVEVIAGRAENALLVPVEALRELAPGQYAVMVMVDGQPQMRQVEVGLMDYAYAEIVSGLEQGDQVSTGILGTE
ncbi:MAG TPA: efflux RND transporter periplasmic adaptor subunit [Anaerolineae bacterium]|nr:efflux RND transporter periplasmic adaptor subunit [Anaerolineae bacterium]